MGKRHLHVAAGLIFKDGRLLITRRPDGRHLAGLWEFPGGKQEGHETLRECLKREIREELGVEIRADNLLLTVEHEYDTKLVTLYLFQCALLKGMPRALEGQEIRWIKLADLPNYSFPPPDKKIIEFLGSLKNPDILPIPG